MTSFIIRDTALIHGIFFGLEWVIRKRKLLKLKFSALIKGLWTFGIVCIAWIFFRASNLETAFQLLCSLLQFDEEWWIKPAKIGVLFSTTRELTFFGLAAALFLSLEIILGKTNTGVGFEKFPQWLRWIIYYVLVLLILLLGRFDNAPAFIYFQF